MPTFGPGLPPPRNPEEELLHVQIKAGTLQMLDAGLEAFNQTRLQLGLSPLAHVADQIEVARLFLLGTSRSFDFPVETLPAQIRYVGPQLDEPAWTQRWTSPWLSSDQRPLIAVGFSTSFQNHAQALQKVIDAAGRLPVRTLITLGQINPSDVKPASNTSLVSSAPHNAVMSQAAVVVTHGGHGTVMRALLHKCPMLIVPHGRDQDENAIRVTERGAGLCLPGTATSEEIHHALKQLLEEPSFTQAAVRLGEAIAAEMEETSVVSELESLVCGTKECSCLAS